MQLYLGMMKASLVLVSLTGIVSATIQPPPGCAYDKCFWKSELPQEWKPLVTKFCKALIGKKPCSSTSSIPFSTIIESLPATTIDQTPEPTTVFETIQFTETSLETVIVTATEVQNTVCETIVSTSYTTSISYPRHTPVSQPQKRVAAGLAAQDDPRYQHRMKRSTLPGFASAGCTKPPSLQALKDACRCFLSSGSPPVQATTVQRPGSTIVNTLPAQTSTVVQTVPPAVITISTTNTITATEQSCTSTSTSFVAVGTLSSCGAPAGIYPSRTTGQISCTQPASAPSGSVNAFHRIEADNTQGTVYEGCIYAGPRSISTPSGGTHQCGASTGTSITGQTDAAAMLTGFTYDGTFSPSFNDYFITRIGATQQSGTSYWGVLNNGVFTTSGGCGAQVRPGDVSLWQWDAFILQRLLTITPQYAVVAAGEQVSLRVSGRSPNGGSSSPVQGAQLSGATALVSDANGDITLEAPRAPGCYQYKATQAGAGRSNAFYLNVVAEFPVVIG